MAHDSEHPSPISVQVGGLKIKGFVKPASGVANYLGIQYATIPARFRQPQSVDLASLDGELDATQYGPRCPQNTPPRGETAHLYEGVARSADSQMDELGCLRLNIYTPSQHQGPLPVLVWIHGGGFIFGDGNSDFDGNFLVRHSVDLGKPIIVVAMNYRLGYLGFLTSKELKSEAAKDGQTPFANMAMCDQRVALLWIRKYIHHFGGDASNVTIAGESAGGWSVLAHLRSNVHVCERGFIMSSPNLDFPRPDEAQATFDELATSVGVSSSASDEVKLAALRALPAMEIVALMKRQFATPLWDAEWFVYQDGRKPTAGPAPFAPWVKGVVVGSTQEEAAVFGLTGWRTWKFSQFEDRVKSAFSDVELAAAIMKAYNITSASSEEEHLQGFLDIITDSIFSGLPFVVAESSIKDTSPPVSIYKFVQPDSFSQSLLRGYAYHTLDNIFFFRLPSVAGPNAEPNARETANRFSGAVIDLTYGSQPWEIYHKKKNIMVFNGMESGLSEYPGVDRWRQITESWDPTKAKGVQRAGHKVLGIQHASLMD